MPIMARCHTCGKSLENYQGEDYCSRCDRLWSRTDHLMEVLNILYPDSHDVNFIGNIIEIRIKGE